MGLFKPARAGVEPGALAATPATGNFLTRRFKFFYGWWIVVAHIISEGLHAGTVSHGFTAFFLPLEKEFGASRTAISGVFSLSQMESGILGPVEGWLIDRFGTRKLMLLFSLLGGGGLILLSRADSLTTFGLVFILMASLGMKAAFTMIPIIATANWFVKKRSLALGIGMSGMGLAGLIVPLVGWLITSYGWRQAFVIIGVGAIVIGAPLSLIMRHKPEQHGLLPDGDSPDEVKPAAKAASAGHHGGHAVSGPAGDNDFTLRQAVKTSAFWLVFFSFGLRLAIVGAFSVHFIPFLVSVGIDYQTAAALTGGISLVGIVGRLGFGWLGDIFDKRLLTAACLVIIGGAMLYLTQVRSTWQVILFVAVYAVPYGGASVLLRAITGDFFGRKAFGAIYGAIGIALMAGSALGPLFMGYVWDRSKATTGEGSYTTAFVIGAIGAMVALALILLAKPPKLKKAEVRNAPRS